MRLVLLLGVAALCLGSSLVLAGDPVRVVDEGGIGDRWKFPAGVSPAGVGYPSEFVPLALDVCIALGYRINPDGRTSGFVLLDKWNSASGTVEPAAGFWPAFSGAAADAVSKWRFEPRPGITDIAPEFTVATVGFIGGREMDLAGIRAKCRIGDLAAHLAAMVDGQRKQVELERMDQAYRLRERTTNEALSRPAGSANPYSR